MSTTRATTTASTEVRNKFSSIMEEWTNLNGKNFRKRSSPTEELKKEGGVIPDRSVRQCIDRAGSEVTVMKREIGRHENERNMYQREHVGILREITTIIRRGTFFPP